MRTFTVKRQPFYFAVGCLAALALGWRAVTTANYVLLVLVVFALVVLVGAWIEDRGMRITDEEVYRPKLVGSARRIKWANVERVFYRRGLLTIEGGRDTIVINQHYIRNREELIQFIRDHAPQSAVRL